MTSRTGEADQSVDRKRSRDRATYHLEDDRFSPTAAMIWELIDGNRKVGQEVTLSISALKASLRRTRPALTKALMFLRVEGYLEDLTPDPRTNQPHKYRVLRGRDTVQAGETQS